MSYNIHMYEATAVDSYAEAVEQNIHYTIPLYGTYDTVDDNNLMDVIRASCLASTLVTPIVVLEKEDKIIGVFHPGSELPF